MQINTGAPIPAGADVVVPVEDTQFDEASQSVSVGQAYTAGKHITNRATYVRAGDRVLSAGMRMGPAQIAVAATAGAGLVNVYARPTVAVLATGDELVHHSRQPAGAQIRNSNGPMLEALLRVDGATVISLDVAADDRDVLHEKIAEGLEHDCLCITGGVSMGQFDFVPEILDQRGVRFAFQKVAIRPGKPTAFGVTESGGYVFALPGNPISAYVGYILFVRPALALMQGQQDAFAATIAATLDGTQSATGNRDSFWPARVTVDPSGHLIAQALHWSGSGDPFGMAEANAFVVRPAQSPAANAGDTVRVMLLDAL
jgi:molybdopterin molybdotransferase